MLDSRPKDRLSVWKIQLTTVGDSTEGKKSLFFFLFFFQFMFFIHFFDNYVLPCLNNLFYGNLAPPPIAVF